LPEDCAVEVACPVDATGIHPTRVGALPPQLTALIRTNVNVQELTVDALMTENREHIYHAAMMDPHTAAELDLESIWRLVDELIARTAIGCRHGRRERRWRGLGCLAPACGRHSVDAQLRM
jgi:alpha-galactosidase